MIHFVIRHYCGREFAFEMTSWIVVGHVHLEDHVFPVHVYGKKSFCESVV
jgi:hypothetical protein